MQQNKLNEIAEQSLDLGAFHCECQKVFQEFHLKTKLTLQAKTF